MELVNSKEIMQNALDNHYGIGAFNFINIETLKSILDSAEEKKSPVIVQCSTGAIKYAGLETLVAIEFALSESFVTLIISLTTKTVKTTHLLILLF